MAELAVEAGHLDPDEGGRRGVRDDALVEATIAAHAPALLRTARRHSLCADDAHDAYQRALEIFLRRAGSLRRETVAQWLHTVVKHEAMAVRAQRQQLVAGEEVDFDAQEAVLAPSVEERVVGFDRTARAAEAFSRLKPQEVTALWLKAQGLSYQEIAARQGWTYTKVNRCLTEGRKAFLERFAGIESGAECERWAPALSALLDGEATKPELRELRPHLRRCAACRASLRELRSSGTSLAGVLPVALVVPAAAQGGAGPRELLAQAWDALTGAVHERAAASLLHVQAATEAASTAKLAAVAASAVVMAGGGVAVEQSGALRGGTPAKPAAAAVATPIDRSTPAQAVTAAPLALPRARVRATPKRRTPAARPRQQPAAKRHPSTAPQPAAASPPSFKAPGPAAARGEFGVE